MRHATSAYADARAKAEQYAGLAGQALGEVRHVVEAEIGGGVAPRGKAMAMAAADAGGDARSTPARERSPRSSRSPGRSARRL